MWELVVEYQNHPIVRMKCKYINSVDRSAPSILSIMTIQFFCNFVNSMLLGTLQDPVHYVLTDFLAIKCLVLFIG